MDEWKMDGWTDGWVDRWREMRDGWIDDRYVFASVYVYVSFTFSVCPLSLSLTFYLYLPLSSPLFLSPSLLLPESVPPHLHNLHGSPEPSE